MDIPKDKNYPHDAVQCDDCGGNGCPTCSEKGWLVSVHSSQDLFDGPASGDHPKGRQCHYAECGKYLPPDQIAVYCSNECAMADI